MTDASVTTPTGQLGTIVSWRVPGEIPFDALKAAMAAATIPPDLATELQPVHALTRALAEMRKGRVIKKQRREDDVIFFQLTKEFLDERKIRYEFETEIGVDAKTGVLTCSNSEIKAAAAVLLAEHQAKRLTSDLTRLLQRFYGHFEADLIPIREQGGAYFVPEMHKNLVDQTRTFLEQIGGRLRNFDVRLGSDDTSKSVAESMTDYMKQLITDFRESCEDVDGTSRKDVKERRRGTVSELRRKMELYRDLMGSYTEIIDVQIKTSEDELLRKLAVGAPETDD